MPKSMSHDRSMRCVRSSFQRTSSRAERERTGMHGQDRADGASRGKARCQESAEAPIRCDRTSHDVDAIVRDTTPNRAGVREGSRRSRRRRASWYDEPDHRQEATPLHRDWTGRLVRQAEAGRPKYGNRRDCHHDHSNYTRRNTEEGNRVRHALDGDGARYLSIDRGSDLLGILARAAPYGVILTVWRPVLR